MRFFAAALIFFGVAASYAQTPQVPHKIHFAGMLLTIRDDARREIQKDVDALTKHSKYFDMKAERAKTYFPIIEKIFNEEQLPEDFKFLALQESSLEPDAVSPSNAVGFWQFKDFTAQEMGLRVDHQVDERMNIVSASRGAARYIKQNNWRFNNWVLALQAYQMGAGGVERSVGDKYNGDSHMEINSETYWYVKKYLAHKVAFENACKGAPKLSVALYETKGERKLKDIAGEVSVDENVLKDFNKWAKRGTVPDDKRYVVVVPTGNRVIDFSSSLTAAPEKISKIVPIKARETSSNIIAVADLTTQINGVAAIKSFPGETLSTLAARAGVDVSRFIKYNDVSIDHKIRSDIYYFIEKKKKKNAASTYTTKQGDDLWLVSQQFGVRLNELKKLNSGIDNRLIAGTFIRLNAKTTLPEEVLGVETDEVAQLSNDTFAWAAQPTAKKLPVKLAEVKYTETNTTVNEEAVIQNMKVSSPQVDRAPKETDTLIYDVKGSDTLYSIARQFGATIKEIMDWNNKSALTVTTGEKLKILKR